jgi:serine/threonine protein kinase
MRIGRYDVIQELGAGGMGIVFKGLDPEQGRPVAIKMIGNHATIQTTLFAKGPRHLPEGRDIQRRMMLVKEARLSSELNHRNIVHVYDYGVHAGLLYIVMEYLEGQSLDRRLRAQPALSLSKRVGIVAQLCDALGFAHAHGVIHRDVKPANTFVRTDGIVKVLDFGLAAKLAEGSGKANALAGTAPYMAPESIFGKGGFDGRVDIWAAGITLYEAVAGHTPFAAPSVGQTLMRIVNNPMPALPRELPCVETFEWILGTALAKDPAQRYRTADELASELRKLEIELAGAEAGTISSAGEDRAAASHETTYYAGGFGFNIGLSGSTSAVTTATRVIRARRILEKVDSVDYPKVFHDWVGWSVVALFLFGIVLALVSRIGPVTDFAGRFFTTGFAWILGINVALMALGLTLLMAAPSPLAFLEYLEALPRCRNCKSWMRLRTQWTRFAHTNDAVNLGFSDCVAALEQNLWEDAAKLLFLHGDETTPTIANTLVSPPIRYHLDFFECQPCDHQCARVTVEDKSEEDWIVREGQLEAYKSSMEPRKAGAFAWKFENIFRAVHPAARAAVAPLARHRVILLILGALLLLIALPRLVPLLPGLALALLFVPILIVFLVFLGSFAGAITRLISRRSDR